MYMYLSCSIIVNVLYNVAVMCRLQACSKECKFFVNFTCHNNVRHLGSIVYLQSCMQWGVDKVAQLNHTYELWLLL